MYQSTDKQIDKQLINNCETTDKQLITNNNDNKDIIDINNYIYSEPEEKIDVSGIIARYEKMKHR